MPGVGDGAAAGFDEQAPQTYSQRSGAEDPVGHGQLDFASATARFPAEEAVDVVSLFVGETREPQRRSEFSVVPEPFVRGGAKPSAAG